MKTPFLLILLVFNTSLLLAQDYDLIVSTKGDSIACHIDSIDNNRIYFEMKIKGKWIHTALALEQVSNYEFSTIDEDEVIFKAGTSYMRTRKAVTSLKDIRKNAVYMESLGVILGSINYNRIIPISEHLGLVVKVGAVQYANWSFLGETSLLIGSTRHFFEASISYNEERFHRLGYRYIARKWLTVKGGAILGPHIPILPYYGIGVAF